ncbi:MAG: DUF502 domain-containing protein [Candidatus Omnitrophica bacterium]|nr:DUF502 domain-containing protein [Candidatus Omnitrophota bacterium]
MRAWRKYFFTGLAVVLPAILTILVFQYLWTIAIALIVDPLYRILPFDVDRVMAETVIKILIFMVVLGAVCLVGFAANLFFIKQLIHLGEELLSRVPMVNRVYSVLKEISTAMVGRDDKQEMFRSAVLIEYPRKGLYSVAFLTKSYHEVLSKRAGERLSSVFLPTTPNPTSGVLLFLPKEEIIEIPLTVEEAVKLVISAGTLTGKTLMDARPDAKSPGTDR